MHRIWNIMTDPSDPEVKFNRVMKLFDDLNASYFDTLFIFNSEFKACWDGELHYSSPSNFTSSIIRMSENNCGHAPQDIYAKQWRKTFLDHVLIRTYFGYFNKALYEMQRAVLVSKHFRNLGGIQRKDVLNRYGISWREYENQYIYAREVLIECWYLDACGNASDDGELCDKEYIDYLREQRTGIPGGYISKNSSWNSYYDGIDQALRDAVNTQSILETLFHGTYLDKK